MHFYPLEPKFSPESDVHYVNIRFGSQDYTACDFLLLRIMRNAINLQTAVITQHCPMAKFEYGIVSIKIQGKYDSKEEVYAVALEMVIMWQQENNGQGNFIFDRDGIWWRNYTCNPVRPNAPRLPELTPLLRRRRSAGSVSLPIKVNARRIRRLLLKDE